MAKRDYYEVLGVERDADGAAIKRAYRKLAIQFHPDRNKAEDAADRFKEVSEAYAVLSDPEKRQRYDQYGHAGIDQQYSAEDIFRGADFGDIFRGGMGSIFDMFFGGQRGPSRGRDLEAQHTVTLEEAFAGTSTELTYWRLEDCTKCKGSGAEPGSDVSTCPTCRGQGQVQHQQRTPFGIISQVGLCPDCRGEGRRISDPCHTCKGTGHERRKKTISIDVPAGIEDGQSLRVAGKGEVGSRGSAPGDLYVRVRVKPHARFHREGADLLTEVPVSFPQAVLGAEVEVTTIDGSVTVTVPSGSETGKTLRLRGKGMPYLRGSGRGDLHVRLRIVVPDKVDDEVRGLLERLATHLDGDVKVRKGFFDFLRH